MGIETFRVKVEPLQPGTCVTLSGGLAEHVSLQATASAAAAPVTIDLADVRCIDSIGVREWVDFLRALPRPIVLQRCSEAMVYQFGMIKETLQDAQVASFFAPFECEGCGNERRIEIVVSPGVAAWQELVLPRVTCDACGGALVLAEHPERYLAFLGID